VASWLYDLVHGELVIPYLPRLDPDTVQSVLHNDVLCNYIRDTGQTVVLPKSSHTVSTFQRKKDGMIKQMLLHVQNIMVFFFFFFFFFLNCAQN
jgi:hypothetical protein